MHNFDFYVEIRIWSTIDDSERVLQCIQKDSFYADHLLAVTGNARYLKTSGLWEAILPSNSCRSIIEALELSGISYE